MNKINDKVKERIFMRLREKVNDEWGFVIDDDLALKEIYLEETTGLAFPDKYIGDDLLLDIENKFTKLFDSIIEEFENELRLYVVPSYESPTVILITFKGISIFETSIKSWKFWFNSSLELMEYMYSIYLELLRKISENTNTSEFNDIVKKVFDKLNNEGYSHYKGDIEPDGDTHYFVKNKSMIAITIWDDADNDAIKEIKSLHAIVSEE